MIVEREIVIKKGDLSPAEYQKASREIDGAGGPRMGIHILASFSAQFVIPYLQVEAHRLGMVLQATVGPFMQFEQEVDDAQSLLWRENNRAVLLLMRPEDVDPDLFRDSGNCVPADHLAKIRERMLTILRALRAQSTTPIFVANAALPWTGFDASDPESLVYVVQDHNRLLAQMAKSIDDCHIFDWAGCVAGFGAGPWTDARLWYLGRLACSQPATVALAQSLARHLGSLFLPRAKCVVVDLDDTLWGGVIGDDGIEGIALGGDYPGNAFKDVQYQLKALTRRGILLAMASKNYEAPVREVFDKHPELVLRWDDFASRRINWDSKTDNVREIARELNIGCDSLVFLDNDPVECEKMRRELPEVTTVCMGREPFEFGRILSSIPALDRAYLTREDALRPQMYQQEVRREEIRNQAVSISDFLCSLSMEAQVGLCDSTSLQRISQLTAKTNQFNLTTRRHTIEQIRAMAKDENYRVMYLRLRDVYGDLGLVCVAILGRSAESTGDWHIDTFLMSCRVMGRGVEDAFLSYLAECAVTEGGRLLGEYIPSARNQIVKDFYTQHGFRPIETQNGTARFVLELLNGTLSWPDHITRI